MAIGVVALAFSAALYIHQRHTWSRVFMGPRTRSGFGYNSPLLRARQHSSWEDPTAVLTALGGIAVAVGIVAYRNPRFAQSS